MKGKSIDLSIEDGDNHAKKCGIGVRVEWKYVENSSPIKTKAEDLLNLGSPEKLLLYGANPQFNGNLIISISDSGLKGSVQNSTFAS